MTWYAIYQQLGKTECCDVKIKFGFSYPAFFFTWIWAIYKRLYLLALLSFVFGILTPFSVFFYVISILPPLAWAPADGTKNIVSFALNAVPLLLSWGTQVSLGFFGNKIYRINTEKNKDFILHMATHYNRGTINCYEKIFTSRFCLIIWHEVYSGCISGLLLSSVTLWVWMHNLFPIR